MTTSVSHYGTAETHTFIDPTFQDLLEPCELSGDLECPPRPFSRLFQDPAEGMILSYA